MYPVLELWGRSIPTYSLMAIIGLLAAYLLMMLLCRRFGINRENVSYIYLGAILGGVICAKILYLITAIPYLRTDINTVIRSGDNRLWLVLIATYLSGGFVFYGGMIGAGIGAWAMCRLFHWRLADHLTVLAPAIPLFHAFGRIGCLLTGCCYGIPWSWGYQLNASQYAPHHVTLFPVEALESAAEFLFLPHHPRLGAARQPAFMGRARRMGGDVRPATVRRRILPRRRHAWIPGAVLHIPVDQHRTDGRRGLVSHHP